MKIISRVIINMKEQISLIYMYNTCDISYISWECLRCLMTVH